MTLRVGVVIGTEHDGGGEQYLLRLYRGLTRQHDVSATLLGSIVGWSDTGLDQVDVGLGPKWTMSDLGQLLRSASRERRSAISAIRDAHERDPFDVFHLQYKREQLLLSGPLSALAPVVWSEHGRLPDGAVGRAVRAAYRRAARSVDTIICVSDDVRGDVRSACATGTRATTISNAVDDARFHPPASEGERRELRSQLGVDPTLTVLSTVSRLHRHKRIDRAFELVRGRDDTVLVVAGDGEDRDRLERIARDLPVYFVGWVDEPALVHRASDASILCFSSRGEGFPITMVEAAASGCALIGLAGDAMNTEVNAAGGLVVDPTSPLTDEQVAGLGSRRDRALAWSAAHRWEPWLERHLDVLTAAASRDAADS